MTSRALSTVETSLFPKSKTASFRSNSPRLLSALSAATFFACPALSILISSFWSPLIRLMYSVPTILFRCRAFFTSASTSGLFFRAISFAASIFALFSAMHRSRSSGDKSLLCFRTKFSCRRLAMRSTPFSLSASIFSERETSSSSLS